MEQEAEQPKTRKRKLLTDPESLWAKCKVCLEPGNLEKLIRHQLPAQDKNGVELYQSFTYIYFCSENCQSNYERK